MNNLILDEDFANLIANLSDRQRDAGNIKDCLYYIEQVKNIFKGLDKKYPYISCLERIGHIYIQQGQSNEGITYIQEAKEKAEELCHESPDNLDYKETCSIIYQKLGDYYLENSEIDLAQGYYEKECSTKRFLYKIHLQNNEHMPHYRNLLATSYERMGVLRGRQNDFKGSKRYFEEGLSLYPTDIIADENAQDRIAALKIRVGEIIQMEGDEDNAVLYFQEALKIYENLPQNISKVSIQDNLCVAYQKVGVIYINKKMFSAAFPIFQKQRDLSLKLCNNQNQNMNSLNNLAIAYLYLGYIDKWHFKNNRNALSYFKKAETIWSNLCQKSKTLQFRNGLAEVQKEIAAIS